MPGGFRPRSRSEDSRRARSLTSKPEHKGEERRLARMPVPETYKPKRLSSPFRPSSPKEPEYPADWPLASPPETEANSPTKELQPTVFAPPTVHEPDLEEDSSPEIHSPRVPMESDVFDRMFVESFPGTPTAEFEGNPLARVRSQRKSDVPRRETGGEPALETDMLGAGVRHHNFSVGIIEPTELDKRLQSEHTSTSEQNLVVPEIPAEEQPTPNSIATDISEGEVQDASYFHIHPAVQRTPRPSTSAVGKQERAKSTPPVSPILLKLKIPGSQAEASTELADDEKEGGQPALIKRASVASIASLPRSELKSIDLPRRSSQSSVPSVPQTPRDSVPVSAIEPGSARRTPTSPLSYIGFPSGPLPSGSLPASPVSPVEGDIPPPRSRFATVPLGALADDGLTASPADTTSGESPAPLNAVMSKRKEKRLANGVKALPKPPPEPLRLGEDSFDRHVSEVVERLPSAAIKFRSRPGAETPVSRTAEPRNYVGPRPKAARVASKTGPGNLTLAPAEASPKKSATESEVKLYHLTQAGRDEPIKLFVRLVGDGERVMVRVGGGWADLADYLRQYAEHHGSRTVSSSGIEVQTADSSPAPNRKGSSSVVEPKAKGRPMTPSSAGPRSESRAGEADWLSQPQPKFSMGDDTPTDEESPSPFPMHQQTPTNTIATQRSTPKSTSTNAGSRPSTADSNIRPSSRLAWTEAGMAGPANGKRGDLSEHKERWVEDMIERAKAASTEKSKEEKAKYFGELGKAGGTRRVIFRQSSTIGNGSNGGEVGKT